MNIPLNSLDESNKKAVRVQVKVMKELIWICKEVPALKKLPSSLRHMVKIS